MQEQKGRVVSTHKYEEAATSVRASLASIATDVEDHRSCREPVMTNLLPLAATDSQEALPIMNVHDEGSVKSSSTSLWTLGWLNSQSRLSGWEDAIRRPLHFVTKPEYYVGPRLPAACVLAWSVSVGPCGLVSSGRRTWSSEVILLR